MNFSGTASICDANFEDVENTRSHPAILPLSNDDTVWDSSDPARTVSARWLTRRKAPIRVRADLTSDSFFTSCFVH